MEMERPIDVVLPLLQRQQEPGDWEPVVGGKPLASPNPESETGRSTLLLNVLIPREVVPVDWRGRPGTPSHHSGSSIHGTSRISLSRAY